MPKFTPLRICGLASKHLYISFPWIDFSGFKKQNRSELMKGIRIFGSLLLANFSFSVVQKVLLRNMNLQYSMTLQ